MKVGAGTVLGVALMVSVFIPAAIKWIGLESRTVAVMLSVDSTHSVRRVAHGRIYVVGPDGRERTFDVDELQQQLREKDATARAGFWHFQLFLAGVVGLCCCLTPYATRSGHEELSLLIASVLVALWNGVWMAWALIGGRAINVTMLALSATGLAAGFGAFMYRPYGRTMALAHGALGLVIGGVGALLGWRVVRAEPIGWIVFYLRELTLMIWAAIVIWFFSKAWVRHRFEVYKV